jgi:hypothetical protein
MTNLNTLSVERLETMHNSGTRVLECYRILQKLNFNVVGELISTADDFYEWDHYPDGDAYDHETHAQYYYHAHPPGDRTEVFGDENGHFHTFLRPKGMPKHIKPVPLPDYEDPEGDNDDLTHIIGISMNAAGYPVRLFTTNRWVTGEAWYTAENIIEILDVFDIDLPWPSWPTNIWVTHFLQLFQPTIVGLLKERDKVLADWQVRHPGVNAYEDRDLEITSIKEISVENQITAIGDALKKKKQA